MKRRGLKKCVFFLLFPKGISPPQPFFSSSIDIVNIMTHLPLSYSLLSQVMASISKPSPENQIRDFTEISQTSQTSHDPGRKKGSHEGRL